MQFQHRQFGRSTLLALRPHGLYVRQRDIWGQVQLELEVPYEEVLPLRLERVRRESKLRIPWYTQLALLLGLNPLAHYFTYQFNTIQLWTLIGVFMTLCIVLVEYAVRHGFWNTVLRTSRTQLVLAEQSCSRAALQQFAAVLETSAKTYLRQEYGQVNPLGPIELQLRRLGWLRELEVLSSGEARALTTRLTGQVPAGPLRSLGQELEGLFVN